MPPGTGTTPTRGTESASLTGMWVDNAQRDRIFEMIGTHSVTHHPAHNGRLEHQRTVLAAFVVGAVGLWIVLLVF